MDLPVKIEPPEDVEDITLDNTPVYTLQPPKYEALEQSSCTSTRKYNCHLCDYFTNDGGNFRRHQKGKHKLTVASIKKNEIHVKAEPDLIKGVDVLTETKIFNCHLCDYSTNDRGNFKRHQKSKHKLGESIVKEETELVSMDSEFTETKEDKSGLLLIIPCLFCEFQTGSKFNMINHVQTTHSDVSLDVSNVKSCKFCSFTTKCRKTMRYHKKTEHTELLTVYPCSECTFQTNSEESLKLHRKFHGEMKDYPGVKCDHCDFIYKHHPSDELGSRRCKKQLNEHMNDEHAELKLKCDHCEKSFWSQRQLKVHTVRHVNSAENGSLSCDKCDYQCKSAHTLKHHIDAVHLGVKKHLCDWCPKAFGTKSTLNKHILSHTDERNFKCQFCEKAFHTKGNLATHIR